MALPGVPGTQDYTMSGDARIPWLFSRIYRQKFYAETCCTNICETRFTGELKGVGNQVTINTVPTVRVYTPVIGGRRQWQQCTSPPVTLTVNRELAFDCLIPKEQKVQMWDDDFMGTLSKDARQQMKISIDTLFFASNYASAAAANVGVAAGVKSGATAAVAGTGYNMGATLYPVGINKVNAIEKLFDCESVGDEQTWPDEDRAVVIPTWYKNCLNASDYKDESMTGRTSTFNGGRIGTVGKFKLYHSNLLTPIADGSGKVAYPIMFLHKAAINYVSQLADVEYFEKLQEVRGAGLSGLNIFDWAVTYPDALGVLYCYDNRS